MPIVSNTIVPAEVTSVEPLLVRPAGSANHIPVDGTYTSSPVLGADVLVGFDDAGRLNIVGTQGGDSAASTEPAPSPSTTVVTRQVGLSPADRDKLIAAAANWDDAQQAIADYLAQNPLDSLHLKPNAIRGFHVFPGTIAGTAIVAGTITANEIAAQTIVADRIAANAITGDKIAANAITANKIAVGTVTANEIADGTISGDKIKAGTITADKIAAGVITAPEIAAGSITAAQISIGAVTSSKIANNAVTDAKINTKAVTNAKIDDNAVTKPKIDDDAVDGAKLDNVDVGNSYHIQSANYRAGARGWRIDGAGNAEFASGTFRGTLTTGAGEAFRAVVSERPSSNYIGESLGLRWINGADDATGTNVTAYIDAQAGTTKAPTNRLAIHARNTDKDSTDDVVASVELEATEDGDSVVAIAADKVSWRVGTVPMEFHVRRRIPPREGICAVWFADSDVVQIDAYPTAETEARTHTHSLWPNPYYRAMAVQNSKLYLANELARSMGERNGWYAIRYDLPNLSNKQILQGGLFQNNQGPFARVSDTIWTKASANFYALSSHTTRLVGQDPYSIRNPLTGSGFATATLKTDGTRPFYTFSRNSNSFGRFYFNYILYASRLSTETSGGTRDYTIASYKVGRDILDGLSRHYGHFALDRSSNRLYIVSQKTEARADLECYSTVPPFQRLTDCDFSIGFTENSKILPTNSITEPSIGLLINTADGVNLLANTYTIDNWNPGWVVAADIYDSTLYVLRYARRDNRAKAASGSTDSGTRERHQADTLILSTYDISTHPTQAHRYRDPSGIIRPPERGDIFVSAPRTVNSGAPYFWIQREPEGTTS